MKKKTGISIFVMSVFGSCLAATYYYNRKKIQFRIDQLNIALDDYALKKENSYNPQSSFVEFFDKDRLREAYSRYEKYLDLGLKKDDAFKSVVEDKRNK